MNNEIKFDDSKPVNDLPEGLKYYFFEHHYGDDNDNHIEDIIIESTSKDDAFEAIHRRFRAREANDIDSDTDYLYGIFYDNECVNACEGECECSICRYSRFHFQSEHESESEAEEERKLYHSFSGIIYYGEW